MLWKGAGHVCSIEVGELLETGLTHVDVCVLLYTKIGNRQGLRSGQLTGSRGCASVLVVRPQPEKGKPTPGMNRTILTNAQSKPYDRYLHNLLNISSACTFNHKGPTPKALDMIISWSLQEDPGQTKCPMVVEQLQLFLFKRTLKIFVLRNSFGLIQELLRDM
jgi:hypothetical protein